MAGSPVLSSRAGWLTTALIVVFLLCNFTSIPQYNTQVTPSSPSEPTSNPSTSTPESELDKDPLRIYIPPSAPQHNNPLEDIWAGGSSQPIGVLPADASPQSDSAIPPPPSSAQECPIQPFDISKCPSVQRIQAHTNILPSIKQTLDRPLISYSYTEAASTRLNLQFFVKHGLHNGADFVFILNGETDVGERIIPKVPNVLIVKRENTCCDLGAHAEVLSAERDGGRRPLRDSYKQFILLNAEVRGPFVPHWSRECWSEAYLGRLSEKVKLVGSTINCNSDSLPFIPSTIWALDLPCLEILLSPGGILECFTSTSAVQEGEIRSMSLLREKGYEVDVMLSVFQTEKNGGFAECKNKEDFMSEGSYFGGSVSPFETLFVRVGKTGGEGEEGVEERDENMGLGMGMMVEKLSAWQGMSGYSSYEICK